MTSGNKILDKTLLANVLRKLMQKCSGGSKVNATVHSGDVTITGTIRHEYERRPILRCVAAVQGIRRVIDQLQLEKKRPTDER